MQKKRLSYKMKTIIRDCKTVTKSSRECHFIESFDYNNNVEEAQKASI